MAAHSDELAFFDLSSTENIASNPGRSVCVVRIYLLHILFCIGMGPVLPSVKKIHVLRISL
jgi:hypothetical protein